MIWVQPGNRHTRFFLRAATATADTVVVRGVDVSPSPRLLPGAKSRSPCSWMALGERPGNVPDRNRDPHSVGPYRWPCSVRIASSCGDHREWTLAVVAVAVVAAMVVASATAAANNVCTLFALVLVLSASSSGTNKCCSCWSIRSRRWAARWGESGSSGGG